MKHKFIERECWECEVAISFDPFGKEKIKIVAEIEDDPSGKLDDFIEQFISRYEDIRKDQHDGLLDQGFTFDDLREAHSATELWIGDTCRTPPEEWGIEYLMRFPDGPEISYGLDFSGWNTDGKFTGCH